MRDLTKEFTIPNGVNTLNATASLDPFFGPFESVNEAYNLVPENKRKVGKPFAIYLDSTNSNVKLYYWITNSAGSEWGAIPLLPNIDTDRVVSLGAITVNGSVVTIGLPSSGANIIQINNAIYSRYEPISFTTDPIIVAGNFRKDIIEARADSTVFYLKKGVESTNPVPPAVTEGALFISEVLVTSTGVSAGALNSVVTDSTMKGDGTSGNPLGLSDSKNAEIAGKTTMTAVQTWVNTQIATKQEKTILYADLKTLRDNGELIPGMQYRITDYITTTAQENTQSAGHQFDVIVTADSTSILNENARAALHNGDTYFENAKLESWKLKYCIDNDTSRFLWADETNGKGVIHHMIDDKGNSLFYDFKNIQFKRYKITAVSNSGLEGVYLNTYMGLPDYNNFTIDPGDFIWLYTFNTEYSSNTEDDSLNNVYCRENVIGELFFNNELLELNNNTFGYDFNSNTFGSSCYYNTFGSSCYSNTFGNDFNSNTFGNDCDSNTFGISCKSNTFGSSCYSNTFGSYCDSNTFGNDCNSNTFVSYCKSNTFGSSCYSNTFGSYCDSNTFGNGSTGEFFQYNHIENGCSGINGTPKDWTSQTALYGSSKLYSVQIFGHRTSNSVATTNTYQYYDATGTLVKGTW